MDGNNEWRKLEKWAKFLLTPEELEVKDMENEEGLKKAKQEYEKIKQDEHERYLAELREKHIRDTVTIREDGFNEGVQKGIQKANEEHEKYVAELKEKHIRDTVTIREDGFNEGVQKGIEQGELQKLCKIVKTMHAKNKPIEEIIEITELTKEEIEKIINS